MGNVSLTKTRIEGVYVLEHNVFEDERGYFFESFNEDDFKEAGLDAVFVQDNESSSKKGVLRGLHFQKEHPQGKLVRVSRGEVYDVAVDIREDSPTYGEWFGIVLSDKEKKQLYIDKGLAHGFLVLSDEAVFEYKVTDFYHANDEGEIAWNDPEIGIEWPGVSGDYPGSADPEGYKLDGEFDLVLSDKDAKAPVLSSISQECTGAKKEASHIPFNIPLYVGEEPGFIREAIKSKKIAGDGFFTKQCNQWIEEKMGTQKALLTTSGTTALDMAMLLCDLQPGDEVILPSFTFSSTATAAVLAGAKLVFVDVRPDTMNIDETKIEAAITDKTKVILVMHYGGVACEMDEILAIAEKYNLKVVEDAAQGVMSTYKGKALGTIGDFGCFSFHETKNYSMGEGGAILIKDEKYNEKAEILREKGTDRSKFYRGQVDKYTWLDFGDSYLPSELNAAYLWPQLKVAEEVNENRRHIWERYSRELRQLEERGVAQLPTVPEGCVHNAHLFYILLKDLEERTDFIKHMKDNGVQTMFHYIPLHSAPGGLKYGRFVGEDVYTTKNSERLVRLPLYYGLKESEQDEIVAKALRFFDR